MAISFGFDNIMIFFTALSPIIISSFFVINSFFNADMKGFIWLIGMLITLIVGGGFRFLFRKSAEHPWIREGRSAKPNELPTHDFCDIFEPMFESGRTSTAIDSHALFHGFTLTYLILGNSLNPYSPGTPFIAFYSVIVALDLIYRQIKGCTHNIPFGLLGGILVGGGLGLGWFAAITGLIKTGHTMVYFGSNEDLTKCKLSKRTFSCKMKNSEGLIAAKT
jgi:hypothetical protein